MFSLRLPDDLRPNALARARARFGRIPFDLTVSNPTVSGIEYPPRMLEPLAVPATYTPDPRGVARAREAVAGDYRRRGVVVDPARIVLTASTSEAYGFLFRLLCDPGDEVLVPAPSYPLFGHLAALEGVRAVPYRLNPHDDWQPDPIPPRARAHAIVAVHPNNPTGSLVDRRGRERLARACARDGSALIVDEVFLDFPLESPTAPESFVGDGDVLTFVLGGLSKSIGMPQLKLSWIVVCGPDRLVREALERLEYVADHYLSVGTPVQEALPDLLESGAAIRERIRARCRSNLDTLIEVVAGTPLSVAPPAGGWSAVLRFPRTLSEEALALTLLEGEGVAVHPGFFFDFEDEGYLVVSLLPPPAVFEEGIRRIAGRMA